MLQLIVKYTNQKIEETITKKNYTDQQLKKKTHVRGVDLVSRQALILGRPLSLSELHFFLNKVYLFHFWFLNAFNILLWVLNNNIYYKIVT